MKILHRFGLIENFGTGITRIFEACQTHKKLVYFSATNRFFQATLGNLNYDKYATKTTSQTSIIDSNSDDKKDLSLRIIRIIE